MVKFPTPTVPSPLTDPTHLSPIDSHVGAERLATWMAEYEKQLAKAVVASAQEAR